MEQDTKGSRTRDRIALAARKVFSAEGFDRATIRSIADVANINPSMVIRYFGSKEELFATVVQFDLRLPDLRAFPPNELGEVLVRHFIARWEESSGELAALLRAAVTHNAARARMKAIFEEQLTAMITEAGQAATAPERAALVSSQMLGLALTRYVLAFDSAAALAPAQIVAAVGPTIQHYLSTISALHCARIGDCLSFKHDGASLGWRHLWSCAI